MKSQAPHEFDRLYIRRSQPSTLQHTIHVHINWILSFWFHTHLSRRFLFSSFFGLRLYAYKFAFSNHIYSVEFGWSTEAVEPCKRFISFANKSVGLSCFYYFSLFGCLRQFARSRIYELIVEYVRSVYILSLYAFVVNSYCEFVWCANVATIVTVVCLRINGKLIDCVRVTVRLLYRLAVCVYICACWYWMQCFVYIFCCRMNRKLVFHNYDI